MVSLHEEVYKAGRAGFSYRRYGLSWPFLSRSLGGLCGKRLGGYVAVSCLWVLVLDVLVLCGL